MKTAFLVLGAQRSGTSVASHVLSEFGVNFGNRDRFLQADHNPIFFELKWVNQYNDALIRSLGHQYIDVFLPIESDYQTLDPSVDASALKAKIQQEWNGDDCIGIKDPRISLTFPIWEKALRELEYDLKIVLVFRHPMGFLASNKRLFENWEGWTDDRHFTFWLQLNLAAAYFTCHNSVYYLNYDRLLANPPAETADLAHCLQLDSMHIDAAASVVQPSYAHHQATALTGNEWVDRCYRSLCDYQLPSEEYLKFREEMQPSKLSATN